MGAHLIPPLSSYTYDNTFKLLLGQLPHKQSQTNRNKRSNMCDDVTETLTVVDYTSLSYVITCNLKCTIFFIRRS